MTEPSTFSVAERAAVDYFEQCGYEVVEASGEWLFTSAGEAEFSITALVQAILGNVTLRAIKGVEI